MHPNIKFIRAIGASGFDFEDVAIFAGTLSNYIVRIAQNKLEPDEELKQRLSDILDVPVEELWPEEGKK